MRVEKREKSLWDVCCVSLIERDRAWRVNDFIFDACVCGLIIHHHYSVLSPPLSLSLSLSLSSLFLFSLCLMYWWHLFQFWDPFNQRQSVGERERRKGWKFMNEFFLTRFLCAILSLFFIYFHLDRIVKSKQWPHNWRWLDLNCRRMW